MSPSKGIASSTMFYPLDSCSILVIFLSTGMRQPPCSLDVTLPSGTESLCIIGPAPRTGCRGPPPIWRLASPCRRAPWRTWLTISPVRAGHVASHLHERSRCRSRRCGRGCTASAASPSRTPRSCSSSSKWTSIYPAIMRHTGISWAESLGLVIRRLARALLKIHPRLPTRVVRRFVRTRTFIRQRGVNRKRKEDLKRRENIMRKYFANWRPTVGRTYQFVHMTCVWLVFACSIAGRGGRTGNASLCNVPAPAVPLSAVVGGDCRAVNGDRLVGVLWPLCDCVRRGVATDLCSLWSLDCRRSAPSLSAVSDVYKDACTYLYGTVNVQKWPWLESWPLWSSHSHHTVLCFGMTRNWKDVCCDVRMTKSRHHILVISGVYVLTFFPVRLSFSAATS